MSWPRCAVSGSSLLFLPLGPICQVVRARERGEPANQYLIWQIINHQPVTRYAYGIETPAAKPPPKLLCRLRNQLERAVQMCAKRGWVCSVCPVDTQLVGDP